jgi:uncharacterized protein with PQ loop repeat
MAHHHIHTLEKKKSKNSFFDFLIYFFTIATPLFEVPQALAIYESKSAENVSILTWIFFLASDIVWLIYAFRNKIKPLMVMYIFYTIVEVSIVIGIIRYS